MSRYKIFNSPEGDWCVAARSDYLSNNAEILYEGHHETLALEAIIEDQGVVVEHAERNMDSGTYTPTIKDF